MEKVKPFPLKVHIKNLKPREIAATLPPRKPKFETVKKGFKREFSR